MNIYVASLDYDGCLCAKKPQKIGDYIDSNEVLINYIQSIQLQFDKKIFFVGSNRQSLSLDADNGMGGSGSCYTAINFISTHLGAVFDKFTLSDIYLDKAPGYSVDLFFQEVAKLGLQDQIFGMFQFFTIYASEILKPLFEVSSGQFFTVDKINILYAQIQKVAAEHPQDQIVFDFFDDRVDILQSLSAFFTRYPSLMPKNVVLRLFEYSKDTFNPMSKSVSYFNRGLPINPVIIGMGEVDYDYRQTVKKMGEIAAKMETVNDHGYSMSGYITPELLQAKCQEKATLLAEKSASSSNEFSFFKSTAIATVTDVATDQAPLDSTNSFNESSHPSSVIDSVWKAG